MAEKQYIESQYNLAMLDFRAAGTEDAQWEARKQMADLERLAAELFGFQYADELHEKFHGKNEKK